jgi:hypothetical protein
MISVYSINFPAVACLVFLLGIILFHFIASRRREFENSILSSHVDFTENEAPISLRTDRDLCINTPIFFERITCRRLYVGPKAILEGKEIEAEIIVVAGMLQNVSSIRARYELVIEKCVEAAKAVTPKIILGRHSVASIQIVPKETIVIRKKGAVTRGFFASEDEMHRAHQVSSIGMRRTSRVVSPIRKVTTAF